MSELMDVVLACENKLGWSGQPGQPLWKARAGGYARLSAALSRTQPRPSIADLHLAIAYCQRRHQTLTSPAELIGLIDTAKSLTDTTQAPSAVSIDIDTAMSTEHRINDEHSAKWISRLIRSTGPFRAEVLLEWAEFRGE
jgi:hypothetical protein